MILYGFLKKKFRIILLLCVIFILKSYVTVHAMNFAPSILNGELRIKEYSNKIINENIVKNRKIAYLTFDDGPSPNNTLSILNVLNDNNVKATFFVVGCNVEYYPEVVKKLNDSGMCIAVHSYSHKYDEIYKDVDSFVEDIKKCSKVINRYTNKEPSSYIRIPGGSYNEVSGKTSMKELTSKLKDNNINYVDWNIACGDGLGSNIDSDKLIETTKMQCSNENLAVILMHDTYYKKTTAEALPHIIKYLKGEGFVFRTFDDITPLEKRRMVIKKIMNSRA